MAAKKKKAAKKKAAKKTSAKRTSAKKASKKKASKKKGGTRERVVANVEHWRELTTKMLEKLSDGTFDRLEEAIEAIDDLLQKIPSNFTELRARLEKEASAIGEQLRKIYMG